MTNPGDEIEALKLQVMALTERVAQLERRSLPATKSVRADAPAPPDFSSSAEVPPPPPISAPQQRATPQTQAPIKLRSIYDEDRIDAKMNASASMEEKIGQYWLNRVGIVAMLIGISYFLKYAFENNWIGPSGRIVIGIFAGMGLLLWSESFRKRGHNAFSYSLKAIGIGTLYLSLWAAFQIYHLIPAGAAFALMVIVTASTIILALSQDAELLASFALAGGFATPLLISTGENHEVTLFTYVGLLDIAILVVAIVKPWQRLLWGSFAGTTILFLAWSGEYYSKEQRGLTVFFAAIFAAVFAIIPVVFRYEDVVYEKAGKSRVPVTLTILPLLNAMLFFLALYVMYEHEVLTLTWYALVLSAIYLGLAHFSKARSNSEDSNLVHLLHVSIAVAFLTIAIPAKLNARWITIGWLVESAVLLWVSVKTNTNVLRYLAGIALLLGITRLLFFDPLLAETLIFNSRFATYAVAIAILAAIAYYGPQYAPDQGGLSFKAAAVGANLLALIALTWEASDFFNRQLSPNGYGSVLYHEISVARGFTYSAIWLIYGAGLMAFGFWERSALARWQALLLIALTTVKVFALDVSQLGGSYRIISFIALGSVLLGISFVYQRDWLNLAPEKKARDSQ
ncbi:MAG TPA: DUF2339 domain-containing protein [Candidatus Dormibacteraeota bacterium]|nr:DUF2339 domain-containing protein [Candidatus Dormibacteraeota bacterium]